MTHQKMLAIIDQLQTTVGDFIHGGDEFIATLKPDDYEVYGPQLRQMQFRLTRINADLSTLYRRLDL